MSNQDIVVADPCRRSKLWQRVGQPRLPNWEFAAFGSGARVHSIDQRSGNPSDPALLTPKEAEIAEKEAERLGAEAMIDPAAHRERRLEHSIERLPKGWQATIGWLRQPSQRWLRITVGTLLIIGSLLSVLPLFGLWMLPLGLVLLAEDVPFLRRLTDRILEWIERRRSR